MSHVLRILTGREPLYTNNPIPNDSHREIFTKPYRFKSASILLCLTLVRGQISTFYIVGSYRYPFASLGFIWRDHSSTCAVLNQISKFVQNQCSSAAVFLPFSHILPYSPSLGRHKVGGHICDHQASNDAPARQICQAEDHLDQREQNP